MIKRFSSMLTNDRMNRESGYVNRIVAFASDERKKDVMKCLKILFMNSVYEITTERQWDELLYRGTRMREVWLNEGRDEEGRREWERRWRKAGDIMNEEDLMETSIMHLCIPTQTQRKGLILPSECSSSALSMLLCVKSDRQFTYHFPVYDIHDQSSTVVIIRNLPSGFLLESRDELDDHRGFAGRRGRDRFDGGGPGGMGDALKTLLEFVFDRELKNQISKGSPDGAPCSRHFLEPSWSREMYSLHGKILRI